VAIVANALLGYGLIFGAFGLPALGLAGAGIAATLATSAMFAMLLATVLIDRRFRRYHLLGRFWRPDRERFVAIWRLGAPIGATMAFEICAFNAAVFLIGLIDTAQLAAHAIAIQMAAVTFMIPLGVAQAATVRVGLAAGRGDSEGVARAGWTAIGLGVGVMALTALVFLMAPGALTALFLDASRPGSAEVAGFAVSFLAIAAIFQMADGAQATAIGALRGLKDTRVPMLLAGLGYWGLGLPIGAVLAFGLGFEGRGVWIGLAAGLAAVAALLVSRWARLSAPA
jgi:MATE family multidrug resistance protein